LGQKQKPTAAVEVKWSDQFARKPGDLRSLLAFCEANGLRRATVTSRTMTTTSTVRDVELQFVPASVYCFMIGLKNIMWKHIREANPGFVIRPSENAEDAANPAAPGQS
jgi:hypothetical protein